MIRHEIKVHSVQQDGLPDMERLVGRVAFIWDGALISGWPIRASEWEGDPLDIYWEASEDRAGGKYAGVTHWVEFPTEIWSLHRE